MRILSDNDDPETDRLAQQDFMEDQIDQELKQSTFLVPVTRRIWILMTSPRASIFADLGECFYSIFKVKLLDWHIST